MPCSHYKNRITRNGCCPRGPCSRFLGDVLQMQRQYWCGATARETGHGSGDFSNGLQAISRLLILLVLGCGVLAVHRLQSGLKPVSRSRQARCTVYSLGDLLSVSGQSSVPIAPLPAFIPPGATKSRCSTAYIPALHCAHIADGPYE